MKYDHRKTGLQLLGMVVLFAPGVAAQAAVADGMVTQAQCEALAQTVITPAQIGEPVSAVHIDAATWDATAAVVHCRIDGRLLPVDQSASARPINFGVALPASWNGRAVQLGGGGMNGTVPALAGRGPDSQLAQGYATYGSDSGHGMQDEAWLLNDEAIRNLGYMQMKKTHDAAMVLIETLYGAQPEYNYYVGGSQGGREGLTVAQRYPADYDGVLSTVPIVGFSSLMLGPTRSRIEENPLARWVPPAKGTALLAEFMRQCDGLDGLNDGVINNYLSCRAIFNVQDGVGPEQPWAAIQCPNDVDPDPADASAAACVTSGQIETLHFVFSDLDPGIELANGRSSFGMWAPTTAVGSASPFGGLFTGTRYKGQEGAAADAPVFATLGTNGVYGFFMQNLQGNPLDFTIAEHGARYQQLSPWLDTTQADLGAFAARGGKLIAIVGTDDTIAASGEQLHFYQTVLDAMGRDAVNAFARLYVLPQTGHGLTGRAATINGAGETVEAFNLPSQVDRFALLTAWVEQGVAPAHAVTVSSDTRAWPMCSFPAYPHYNSGDVALSSSWSCNTPDLSGL